MSLNLAIALKDLGLSAKEIAVFTALLDIGPSDVRGITARSGINRGTAYDVLENLESQGLVVKSEHGSRLKFSPISPVQLVEVLKAKQAKLQKFQTQVEESLPELMARFGQAGGKPKVSVWEGKNGIRTILADVLESVSREKQKEYLVFSASGLRQDVYKAMPEFSKERIKKHISVKTIALGDGGRLVGLDARKWLDFSPPFKGGAGGGMTYEIIYARKVAHLSLGETGNPMGVIIENYGIFETQKLVFESLWEKLS